MNRSKIWERWRHSSLMMSLRSSFFHFSSWMSVSRVRQFSLSSGFNSRANCHRLNRHEVSLLTVHHSRGSTKLTDWEELSYRGASSQLRISLPELCRRWPSSTWNGSAGTWAADQNNTRNHYIVNLLQKLAFKGRNRQKYLKGA